MVNRRNLFRTWVMALFAVVALAAGLVVAPSASAQALPLSKPRFAVAVGGLSAGSTSNWVRLANYDFHADGTVTEQHWHWTQRRRDTRSYTGIQASGCPTRDCNVQTARGYEGAAHDTLRGTYTVSGGVLRVEWNVNGWWERWQLAEAAGGALATLEFAGSNFGATHGFGYGSTATWNDRVPAAEIAAENHRRFDHTYYLWKTTSANSSPHIDTGSGSPFWVRDWDVCSNGRCLAARSSTPTEFYVAPANANNHRRDTLWHWRAALADGRGEYCYTGNSHVKPMIQIVDDHGGFQGWVGVEASLNQTVPSQGAYADDIGVFRIAAP